MSVSVVAVVPAAGESRRMGRPKLTLPIDGTPVITRLLRALIDGGVEWTVVVGPPEDSPGWLEFVQAAGVDRSILTVSPPARPPDMRSSVALGVSVLARQGGPYDFVILAPADSPGITASLVRSVISAAVERPGKIVVPTVAGKRGHPVALPWSVAMEVLTLPDGLGVNSLLARHASLVCELPVDEPGAVVDLDTPEDYERWSR
ncbi:MAG: nucleotidyltransferase family protein [Isosphaeraceae bacterium]